MRIKITIETNDTSNDTDFPEFGTEEIISQTSNFPDSQEIGHVLAWSGVIKKKYSNYGIEKALSIGLAILKQLIDEEIPEIPDKYIKLEELLKNWELTSV